MLFARLALVVAFAAVVVNGKNVNRPQLLPYNPLPGSAATVIASDGMARFTVLTDRLIRMEYAYTKTRFEDRASLAVLNRNLDVPTFSHGESGGVLTIKTSEVVLKYTVDKGPFTAETLSVEPVSKDSTFPGWTYGQANPGNLLGTIRGQDQQSHTPLNCTMNKHIDDNGEFNHCEWGLVSRDGWVVYDDSRNAFTDENDWWSTTGTQPAPSPAPPSLRNCSIPALANTDAAAATNSGGSQGSTEQTIADCCNKCLSIADCTSYVYEPSAKTCWPLSGTGGTKQATDRFLGSVGAAAPAPKLTGPQFSDVAEDLYGFFHGLSFTDALTDYQKIGGKAIMVPKYAMGVWWSRWFDLNNYDTRKVVADYESRDIPLDVFVIDMDWHTKDDWSGFTFDPHLFPYAEDDMGYLNAKGLAVTLNLHDASGVNHWDAMFPKLIEHLGMPSDSTKVPMNLINETVAYAVEDIVLGDLINNKNIAFWWIDWQQGGSKGGMTGDKQNPTIWLAHLRCTDRHRVGDSTRGMVLARWGGMGHHRYQVGFSGDVGGLTWANLAYQPYFSATAANVLFPSWSHDIEGDWKDLEMYTRWLQVGSFSGTMRSHERGMSAGGCANGATGVTPSQWGPDTGSCSVIAPWGVGPKYFEANRRALQMRERLLPYIYTMHRSLFDTGVGIMQPLYYHFPALDGAYRMNASSNAQYFFGNDIMVAPVTAPSGDAGADINMTAQKQVWMPPGTWFNALNGRLSTVTDAEGTVATHGYTLGEVPMWYKGGSVIPYLPLESLATVVGVGVKQYAFLGFRLIPGASAGSSQSTAVYEDDGGNTDYLDGKAHVWTTCNVTTSTTHAASVADSDEVTTVTIKSTPSGAAPYPKFPATRAYQLRLPNGAPPSSVSVKVASATTAVPYVRFGNVASSRTTPPSHQWYYSFAEDQGLGPVIDVVNVPTDAIITVTITTNGASASAMAKVASAGLYGTLIRAVYAHANMDLDRSNPDSNSPGPAYLSQLASVGVGLEHMANPANDQAVFAASVANVGALLANATAEVGKKKSPRVGYTLDLLNF